MYRTLYHVLMKKCALLTLGERADFVIDDEHAISPLDVVHWNLAKTYMLDLEGKGVGIMPTIWPDAVQGASFPGNVWYFILTRPFVDRVNVV
jgi:hypothetical protein